MADPHRDTLAVYEREATRWEAERSASLAEARAFAGVLSALGPTGRPVVADLGCGPGWHLPALPDGAIALDGAAAMLDLVPAHSPRSPRVRADLRALPFARHSLDGAWANKAYVHIDRRLVPLALWDLHRALRVGGRADLGLFGGDIDLGPFPGDDFPGRAFSAWPAELLRHVIAGAGFSIVSFESHGEPPSQRHRVVVQRERTLADVVGPDMDLLLCGLNPSVYSADRGMGFARAGNRAWPALLASGLAHVDRDPIALFARGVGMTDLIKRATPNAKDLTRAEYQAGFARLDALCGWLRPAAVCVVGLTGWREASGERSAVAGWQDVGLGDRPVYLMPNPSGANAHTNVDDLAHHFRTAAAGHP